MAEPFIGEIKMVGFNFAPRGYATCDGQLLPIAQNTALFSLLGTTYGGNGQTTFALPDLRGRVAIHQGTGAGLTPRQIGSNGGAETATLTTAQLPAHNHPLQAQSAAGNSRDPGGNALAQEATAQTATYSATAPNVAMNAASVGNTGTGQGHENMSPFLVVNFVIALEGIFPPRN